MGTFEDYVQSQVRPADSDLTWKCQTISLLIFSDMGLISPELNSIQQAGFAGALLGGLYGGIRDGSIALGNFMENNQATAYENHIEAKRSLQNKMTIAFSKGFFKMGWRIGLFTTSFV